MAESVPSSFLCPISLEVMKSPVSLSTGVTYDRTSIQAWLDAGHNTCPATMQVLPSKDLTPNLVIRRLIDLWCENSTKDVNGAGVSSRSPLDLLSEIESSAEPLSALKSFMDPDVISAVDPARCIAVLSRLIVSTEGSPKVADCALSCLLSISELRRFGPEIAGEGVVASLGRILSRPSTPHPTAEKALKLMESLAGCAEGRAAICDDATAVTAVLGRMVMAAPAAAEYAIVVVWTICYLFRNRKAQQAVAASNGLAKVLLAMQCNFSAVAREMVRDLFKLFFVNRGGCLQADCDIRATHIMPF
ncbi:U-box domain-containing protein 28-like [Wolffia australiana]